MPALVVPYSVEIQFWSIKDDLELMKYFIEFVFWWVGVAFKVIFTASLDPLQQIILLCFNWVFFSTKFEALILCFMRVPFTRMGFIH